MSKAMAARWERVAKGPNSQTKPPPILEPSSSGSQTWGPDETWEIAMYITIGLVVEERKVISFVVEEREIS